MTPALRLVETSHENFEQFNARRGYVPIYRAGIHCPGCSRSHWYVGRTIAECAFCATALPLVRS